MAQVYGALFFLSFIMLVILVSAFGSRITINYVLLFSTVLIVNFGYMQLSNANDLQAALFANQVTYLGASFSPFFLFMCMADLCKIKVKKWVQYIFILYSAFIFFLTNTIGVLPVYYKTVSLGKANGFSYLIREYGPLHTLYPLYLGTVVVVGIGLLARAIYTRRDVSYKTILVLLLINIMMVALYSVNSIFHLKMNLLPAAYVFSQGGILLLLRRISLYHVTAISADSMVKSQSYGFILCDSRGKYLGCDDAAKSWFPELKVQPIDVPFRNMDSKLLQQIDKWIRRTDERETAYFAVDAVIIEARHTILKEKRNKVIHCIYLRDDTKQQEYTRMIKQYNETLEENVNAKTEKLRQIQDDIIISMASIVENRDSNTGGHIARTSDIMKIFVHRLQEETQFENLTPQVAQCIIKAAPLHDFGKIAVPDVVLNKPGKYTEEDYNEMKKHPAKGAVIVERILQNAEDTLFKDIAVNVAHYHHERWDGAGYPDHIAGENIPFEARVMALADVFDALVSKRVYKDRYSYEKAFSIIRESRGSHFDPTLCDLFLDCRPALEALYDSYAD